jgi:hypothetical protein
MMILSLGKVELGMNNEIIEPVKIQAITTSQLFWHKVSISDRLQYRLEETLVFNWGILPRLNGISLVVRNGNV